MPEENPNNWIIRDRFFGLMTKGDSSKVPSGSCVDGQNVFFTNGDRIASRNLGYEVYPNTVAANTSTTKIASIRTFRKRDGENILVRNQSNALEFFDETTIGWVVIESGFMPGLAFGYAEANINTDQTSYIYMGNSKQNYARWSGAKNHLLVPVAANSTTVKVVATTGFPSPTGTIVIAGTKNRYSAVSAQNFTLVGTADVVAPAGSAVVAGLQEFPTAPKGNILLGHDNRIFVSGITSVLAAVYFSKYGDAANFTGAGVVTDTTADATGIFNLAEGGGPVVGMAFDENSTYFIKHSLIYKAGLTDAGYAITPLKSFDGKSQTTGGITEPFAGENGLFFITPDKKIYNLTRIDNVDYPQLVPISDVIKPTVDALFFEKTKGIVFEDKAFIACASTQGNENDTVLIYDIRNKLWHAKVTGWNVTDWAIYRKNYNTLNESDDELFFAGNNSKNVYKVINIAKDRDFNIQSSATMNEETFDYPAQRKWLKGFFVEGNITKNMTLNITLLFDGGFTQSLTGSIIGTQTDFLFNSTTPNAFGVNPFGVEVIGASGEEVSMKKFRLYLKNNLRAIPFYSIAVKFESEGNNQGWEVLRYAWDVELFSQDENRKLYKSF